MDTRKNKSGRSIKTSMFGGFIIIASVVSVFVKNISWTEAMIGISGGVGLILAKDHDKK
ncbi:MAG: hypothetical protein NTW49_08770 [Bacteroidia bacterium]|nr:hypothetical protein [Bacteroidia bacterium]